MQICSKCGTELRNSLGFCTTCGAVPSSEQGISSSSARACGEGAAGTATAPAPLKGGTFCCLNSDCPDKVIATASDTCPHCDGTNLASLSIDAWRRKYIKREFSENIIELVKRNQKEWVRWAITNMAISEDAATTEFDRIVKEVTGVPSSELEDWFRKGIAKKANRYKTTAKADAHRIALLKNAASRKIKKEAAQRILQETVPKLEIVTTDLRFGIHAYDEPPEPKYLVIRNAMGGTLKVTAIPQEDWLHIDEEPINVHGEEHKLQVQIQMSHLHRGKHVGAICVTSNGGDGKVPVTIRVTRKHWWKRHQTLAKNIALSAALLTGLAMILPYLSSYVSPPKRRPILHPIVVSQREPVVGDIITLTAIADDPDGNRNTLRYEWKADTGKIVEKRDTAELDTAEVGSVTKGIRVTLRVISESGEAVDGEVIILLREAVLRKPNLTKPKSFNSGQTTGICVSVMPSAQEKKDITGQLASPHGGHTDSLRALTYVPIGYPAGGSLAHFVGIVFVDVEIDDLGNVRKAKATAGPSELFTAGENIARHCKFNATASSEEPSRLTLRINYGCK